MNGTELKERRAVLGFTQARLAEVLDVKPNTVARWERGILTVPHTVALAMATVEREHGGAPKAEASAARATPTKRATKRAAKNGGKV
jgi:transcriptional regulator with XRE-family HTH domain